MLRRAEKGPQENEDMSRIELVNEQGCTFDEIELDSSDRIIEWASGRNGTTRIFVDGEPLPWYVRAENEGYTLRDGMGDEWAVPEAGEEEPDFWRSLEAYDEEHGTDLWDLVYEHDVTWLNGCEDFPSPMELTDRIREVSADMRIGVSGHSLILKVTEQAKMLGVGRGDIVSVTIRRKD